MHRSSQRDNQTKQVDKLACQQASADCSASVLRSAKQSAKHHLEKGAARKEYNLLVLISEKLCFGRAFSFAYQWCTPRARRALPAIVAYSLRVATQVSLLQVVALDGFGCKKQLSTVFYCLPSSQRVQIQEALIYQARFALIKKGGSICKNSAVLFTFWQFYSIITLESYLIDKLEFYGNLHSLKRKATIG